jgi:hypothetical protein
MVAAGAAYELERVGVAAFRPALNDADRRNRIRPRPGPRSGAMASPKIGRHLEKVMRD